MQPCVETAYREGHIYGSVLDLGCGQGDIAIYLAAQGLKASAGLCLPCIAGSRLQLQQLSSPASLCTQGCLSKALRCDAR